MDIREEKKAIREKIKNERPLFALSSPDAGERLRALVANEINLPGPSVISGYIPLKGEIDPRPLLHFLHEKGHKLCLPVVIAPHTALTFRAYAPNDPLIQSAMGLEEPPATQEERTPNVMLIPLVAFDQRCHRLGYGGGYFDRSLNVLKKKIPGMRAYGVAYAAQEVSRVPTGHFDVPLDAIITEEKIFWRHHDTVRP